MRLNWVRHVGAAAACLLLLLSMVVTLGHVRADAKPALTFRLSSLGSGSMQATASVQARRGATCVLTVRAGTRVVRLPAIRAVRGTAAWGWVLHKSSKRQTYRLTTTCSSAGRTSKVRVTKSVGRQVGGSGELVVAGSVSAVRGRAVQKAPTAVHEDLPGSKGGVSNPGDKGWCTWGAWNLAPWLGTSVSGNAKVWAVRAHANGLQVGTVPVVGSVFVHEYGDAGHVGVVTAVRGNQVTIKDMNGGALAPSFEAAGEAKNMGAYGRSEWSKYHAWMTVNFGRYAEHTRTIDKYTKFIYKPNEAPNQYEGQIVQWDGDRKSQKTAWLVQQGKRYWIPTSAIYYCLKGRGVGGPAVLPAAVLDSYPDQTGQWADCSSGGISVGSGPAPEDTGAPPGQPAAPSAPTWAEQQGSRGANTFSNPYNASGQGPRVAPYQWVEVSCKVHAPQIQSANPDGYWYRIRSAPWNDQYYAVANTFWNGDVPGQKPYTHHTDFNVPDC